MSVDLITQLAEYGTDHEERQVAVTADEILGAVVPLPVRTARPISVRAMGFALAAAAVGVLVVALPFLLTRSDSPPTQSSTVTTTPTSIASSTTIATETTQTTVAAVGSKPLPDEIRAELSSVVLEIGEILGLPVETIHEVRGDALLQRWPHTAVEGLVFQVFARFDSDHEDDGPIVWVDAFDTPQAASRWLRAETRLEDQHLTDTEWPDRLALGDESGVWRRCGRGCTTRHYVRVGANVIRAQELEFDVATVVEAAVTSLTTEYEPRLELSTASTLTPEAPESLGIRIAATDESRDGTEWAVPPWEFGAEHTGGEGCHVSRVFFDRNDLDIATEYRLMKAELVTEYYRITSEGIYERGLGDGFPLRWEITDTTEQPFDDVARLCDSQRLLSLTDPLGTYTPNAWEVGDIFATGDGSYTAVEKVNSYRLDADQVVAARLLPADSTLTLIHAELSGDSLRLVVRGSHSAVREAFGLTFRELDPADTVTVEYLVHPS